jgi:PAS domain S-box-containing protein
MTPSRAQIDEAAFAISADGREDLTLDEHALLQALFEQTPDRIYFKDRQSRFILINRAQAKLLGLEDPRQAIGKTDADFFAPEHATEALRDEQEVMRTAQPVVGIVEADRLSSGQVADWVSTTKLPLYDNAGRIIGTFGLSRDVTDRKLAEQMLEEKNRRLAEIAQFERDALRKLQEAQAQLVQTEKLVGLGQLAAGVAHEINNPLAVVINDMAVLTRNFAAVKQLLAYYQKAQAALEAALGAALVEAGQNKLIGEARDLSQAIDLPRTLADLDEILARSSQSLRRIRGIVLDLREFARLESTDLNQVDLNRGIESTVSVIRSRAASQHVTIERDLGPLPQVECYPGKINQVVINLINNGIDACHFGGTVTIRTRSEQLEGKPPHVRIEVCDTGVGIDPAIRSRIFDPFFTTKPPGQGTGLSLSISYGIIKDHGGWIEVESMPGQGSRFSVLLPVSRS